MIRALLLLVFVALTVLVGASFAWLNPGKIQLNLAFAEVEILKSQAFAGALAIGWLVGFASTAAYVAKFANDKRRLRKALHQAEAELASLRQLPVRDAV